MLKSNIQRLALSIALLFSIFCAHKTIAQDEKPKWKKTFERLSHEGNDSAIIFLDDIIKEAKATQDSITHCDALCSKSMFYLDDHSYSPAFEALKLAEGIAKYLPLKYKSKVNLHYGMYYEKALLSSEALAYFLKARNGYAEIGNKKRVELCESNMAAIYIDIKDYELSIQYLNKLLIERLGRGDSLKASFTHTYIGYSYFFQKDFKKAAMYYSKAVDYYKNHRDKLIDNYTYGYIGLADCYYELGEFDKAAAIFEELKVNNPFLKNNTYAQVYYYMNKGRNHMGMGDLELAEELMLKAEKLGLTINNQTALEFIYENLAKLHNTKNDFKTSNKYLRLEYQYKDSVYIKRNKKRAIAMQAVYDLQKKQEEISELEQTNISKDKEISAKSLTINIGLFILLIVVFIASMLVVRYREKNLAAKWLKSEVDKRTAELRNKNKEKSLLLREVHHRVKNNLQLVNSFMSIQKHFTDGKTLDDIVNDTQQRVQCMATIHELLYKAENLSDITVDKYLEAIAKEVYKTYRKPGQDIELKLDLAKTKIPLDQMIPCGLILNEMISNSFKYGFKNGDEGEIGVSYKIEGDQVKFHIDDTGIGLEEGKTIESITSMGMTIVDGLVKQLDATMEVQTENGLAFHIQFPYKPYKED